MTGLSAGFRDALLYAAELHASQLRKGSATPYFAHLMSVAALVLENGGDQQQAIAALLHDAVEDQGGLAALEEIRARFGERVAHMVSELSDSHTEPKPAWLQRKTDYLNHLPDAGADVLLISLADKLHNARSILQDYALIGERVWDRFHGGRDGVLWYYRSLSDFFLDRQPGWMAHELERIVRLLEKCS